MSEKSLTHGIKFKDKIGYAMGDMGGLLTFSLIGAFQNKFYTDVLHIQPAKIVVLILVPSAAMVVLYTSMGKRMVLGKPPRPAPMERHMDREERSFSSSVTTEASEP